MNSGGHRYLHGHHDAVLRSHRRRTIETSAAYVIPRLQSDSDVLDAGCGPGSITVGFAAQVPNGSVIGIDSEPSVLDEARSLAEAEGRTNLTFEVGDIYRMGFEAERFDVVHVHNVLQHLDDPVAALGEMRRVCRKQGFVAARESDYGAMFWYPESEALAEWRALYRKVARSAGGEPDAGRHLAAWARSAGFSGVEASASCSCYATAEEKQWWGGLWAERIVQSRFAEQAAGGHLAATEDLERLAEGWQEWVTTPDACFFIPHAEVICTP